MSTLELSACGATLPATDAKVIEKLATVQQVLMHAEQIGLQTEHILHGGMYARTIRLRPASADPEDQIVILGAHIKVPTLVILRGPGSAFVGDGWADFEGPYEVIPGSAGRKQMFSTRGGIELDITMIFPTTARTVEEAEAEFTDEADLLLSRREPGNDLVVITGE